MDHTKTGACVTKNREEALQCRVIDKSTNFHAIKNNYIAPVKYINLFHKHNDEYFLPPSLGISGSITKNIKLTDKVQLRDYQSTAIELAFERFHNKGRSLMITSGTGTGKSFLLLGLIQKFQCSALIVTPSILVAKGLMEKLGPYVNAQTMTADKVRKAKILPDVLIITAASFLKIYDLINGKYDLLLLDENHHLSHNTIKHINMWKGCFICGVTATPQRKGMDKDDFQKYYGLVYDTEQQSLPVKVLTYVYRHKYTIQDYMNAQNGINDTTSPEVLRRLYCNNIDRIKHLKYVIDILHSKGQDKIIIFTDRVDHLEMIAKEFDGCITISGKTQNETVADKMKSMNSYICVAMSACAGEGFDVPSIQVAILFLSTTWINTIEQTAGRARRPYGDKKVAYYVDFTERSYVVSQYRDFGATARLKIYKQLGREVLDITNQVHEKMNVRTYD